MKESKERECPHFDLDKGHNGTCMPNFNPESERLPNVYYIRQFCRGRFEKCDIYKDTFKTER